MPQSLVLAIEPDLRQAAIVKRIVREKALAEIVVVDSRDAAMEAIRTSMPDVLLLSALLSPRDEDELVAHLRTLENAGHLQTHTIPQLASSLDAGEERASRGLLSAFRRKKESAPVAGCDPELFAEEIRTYLQQAADKKQRLQQMAFIAPVRRPEATAAASVSHPSAETEEAAPESSWDSPFEWKPAGSTSRASRSRADAPARTPAPPPPAPEPVIEAPAFEAPSVIKPAAEEPVVTMPVMAETPIPQPVVPAIEPVVVPAPEPVLLKPVAEPTVAPKKAAKPVDAPRPKAVADRPARLTGRVQLRDLIRAQSDADRTRRDRLGPLARWARSDAPPAAQGATVTSDDVRTLISSLAVPPAVASVTYPRGVRLRRVRVPLSADHEGAAQASA